MTANELLILLTENQVDSLLRAARSLPEDKLDWKPAPGARSALDQLQEAATAVTEFWAAFEERKIGWEPAQFADWQKRRSELTTLDQIEASLRKDTSKLVEFIRKVDPAELTAKVELPFPGEHTLGSVLAYHLWNMSYHEGQIYYISTLLE